MTRRARWTLAAVAGRAVDPEQPITGTSGSPVRARTTNTRRTAWTADVRCLLAAVTTCALTACGGPPAPAASPTPATRAAAPAPAASAAPVTGRYAPAVNPADFGSTVDNPYFPLAPGARWEYRSRTADGTETTIVTATANTRTIMGVRCVEVRDTVTVDGQLKEDTLDWYAQHRDGTVWYFGEDTKEYEDGEVRSTQGSWIAGVDGALPGIVMPARPRIGERYRQEYYAGEAEDMAQILATAGRVTVPAGTYDGVLETKDHTPLEPDVLEHKYYARGVGPVLTVDITAGGTRDELISHTG